MLAHSGPQRELNWIIRHASSGTERHTAVIPSLLMTATRSPGRCPAGLSGMLTARGCHSWTLLVLSGCPSKLLLFHLFFCQRLDHRETNHYGSYFFLVLSPLLFTEKHKFCEEPVIALPTICSHLTNIDDNADQLLQGASFLRLNSNSAP